MTINIATTTGGYNNIKEEAKTNDASIFIDTKNFDLFGHFGDDVDFLNEKTIVISTLDYNILSTATPGTNNYALWHNPHITWVVQDDTIWESIGLKDVSISGSSLNIKLSSKESNY